MEAVNENVMRKLAKIKALKESAESIGSEGEAMAAAAMLNELLVRHKLEMTDIQWEQEIKEEPVEAYPVGGGVKYGSHENDWKNTYKDYPDVEVKKKRIQWSEDLARMISRAYGCQWLLNIGSSRITFVGRKSNVAVVEYMYITMYRTIEALSWKEYKTARNKTKWEQIKGFPKTMQSKVKVDYRDLEGYRSAWIDGFVNRVQEMLNDMREKEQADASAGTALMRIDKDKQAASLYMNRYKGGAPMLNGRSSWNEAGQAAGRAKANEVGITARGMNKSVANKQIGS